MDRIIDLFKRNDKGYLKEINKICKKLNDDNIEILCNVYKKLIESDTCEGLYPEHNMCKRILIVLKNFQNNNSVKNIFDQALNHQRISFKTMALHITKGYYDKCDEVEGHLNGLFSSDVVIRKLLVLYCYADDFKTKAYCVIKFKSYLDDPHTFIFRQNIDLNKKMKKIVNEFEF